MSDLYSNEQLDEQILAALSGGPLRFCSVVNTIYPDWDEGMAHERHVDRRLQALKRKNKVRHNKSIQRWEIV